ncbi:2'-5' RNA ligase family protein [Rhodanobacter sp. L36]|uniref:2'-5' RNA ligase family protein n=1 Tax=Rhodanobacter sp. L36 TaxID=1747221 RepID=UPI0020B149EC|nr:2'-5' RNA ligase family protein [Rhodanobacter sp. L36]
MPTSGVRVISSSAPHRTLTDGINYFFALLPDEKARAEIASVEERFRKAHRVSGTAVGAERFHLTLSPMGKPERIRQPLERALVAAAEQVRGKAFDVTLDSAMRFSAKDNRFPFVLCADAASTVSALVLRKAIAEAQLREGLHVSGASSFLPHVTLMYGHAIDAIQESITPIRWTANEFVLVRSFFGRSRHELVGQWALEPSMPVGKIDVDESWELPVDFEPDDDGLDQR